MLKKMTKLIFFCLFLSLPFFACEKPPVEIEYTISPESLSIPAAGGAYEFTVSVEAPATVESVKPSAAWCEVSTSGASPVTVVVTVAPNTDEARSTEVVVSIKSGDTKTSATVKITQDGAEVEEGILINGIKWATRNVDMPGTFAANPEDAGMFYQWNRKIGWSSTDPMINSEGGTTWDISYPEGDTWERVNDPCPSGWRVPTVAELESLVNAGSEWTTLNGVNGRIIGSGEPTLFLPAAGNRSRLTGALGNVGMRGIYWSSATRSTTGASFLSLDSGNFYVTSGGGTRGIGFSVRCVAE